MRLVAPAKINLHLRVGPVSTDGYHPVLTWMCTVALFDTLSINSVNTAGIHFACDDASLPADGRNLVVRATELLLSRARAEPGLSIALEKRIPSGAGLGGGSSDAAQALLGANELLKLGRRTGELAQLAAALGSDVSFFLHGASSVCSGRGEVVKPIDSPTPKFAALMLPKMQLPTPAVYRRFDEMKLGNARVLDPANQPDWHEWSKLPAGELLAELVNDLELPAFSLEPELARLRSESQHLIGRPVRMSGSGSSLFSLFDESTEADAAVAKLAVAHPEVRSIAIELAPELVDDLLPTSRCPRP